MRHGPSYSEIDITKYVKYYLETMLLRINENIKTHAHLIVT